MAWAPDGTVEAVRVRDARGFAWGVQWHPEYDWERDTFSRGIFEAFGEACRLAMSLRYEQAAAE
jgi:putative glutamine amidotransferase